MRRLLGDKKGQGLVEYGMILLAVGIVSIGALSMYGHNVADLFATTAGILPSSEPIYDQPVYIGELIELDLPVNPGSSVAVDISSLQAAINDPSTVYRLDRNISNNRATTAWENLVVENF